MWKNLSQISLCAALIYLPSNCVVFVFSDTSPGILKKKNLINNFPGKRALRNKTLSNVRAMEMNKILWNQLQKKLSLITREKGLRKKSLIWRLPLVSKKRMNKRKGQLISEGNFGVFKSPKKKIIFKLADRMRSIRTTGASKNRD